MAFVNLHLHTIYSFLDGLIKPAELFPRIKELGMNAVAITDHGNMHGVVDFYTQALAFSGAKSIEDAEVKPILGMETYISADDRTKKVRGDTFHLVLLAENEVGYKNLSYLSSYAFIDGFYYKPRIDRNLLKNHSEGLIALSACLGGEIASALIPERLPNKLSKEEQEKYIKSANIDKAVKIAREYQEIFGKENFFIEIQVNGILKQEMINPLLIKVAKIVDAPLVATNDSHYIYREDATVQEVLFAINSKTTVEDTENRLHHETDAFYVKSEEEMRELFAPLGQDGIDAIENTQKIADRCVVKLDLGNHYLPPFDTGDIDSDEYLKKISFEGLEKRFSDGEITSNIPREEYNKRLDYELSIIKQMGFPGYFLIVADFINWAKNNNVPVGPGRGSGAGSLVAYSIGITNLDPLRYGLFFERFLNPERVSMPDFDVDFCQDKRDLVIDYVAKKYGSMNVAHIATFSKMKAKSAVRDVARALGIDLAKTDKLAKILPDKLDMMLHPEKGKDEKKIIARLAEKYDFPKIGDPDLFLKFLNSLKVEEGDLEDFTALKNSFSLFEEERKQIKEDEEYDKIINIAAKIEGMLRQSGKHACGMVIGDKPVYNYSPMFVDKDGFKITQYDKNFVELVGMVKFDFLGLKTLTTIASAEEFVRLKNPDFDINKIPIDDKETYDFLCKESTKGVFQMESGGFEKMIHGMKPDRIEDLIAGVALYRPGPMDIIPNYIRRKHGKEPVEYDHPWLEEILKETNGLIVYQEQVMQISQKMAGFTLGKADILRRAMGKKKVKDMERMKIEFLAGAKEKGIEEAVAIKVFEHMEKFASYGFNKSHAACYAYISYQTAYLKTHYPVEFFASFISNEKDAVKQVEYIKDADTMGIKVFPPDVNLSQHSFSLENGNIRFGLGSVKNVGEGAVEAIIKEREKNGKFKSLLDFTSRVNQTLSNTRTVEYLIKAGAFDFTNINRGILLDILPMAFQKGEQVQKDKEVGQTSLFAMFGGETSGNNDYSTDDYSLIKSQNNAWNVFHSLFVEKEVIGLYLSQKPADFFKKEEKFLGFDNIQSIINARMEGNSNYNSNFATFLAIITSEIKPKKGRNGGYFIKGVMESSNGTMNFTIGNIDSSNTLFKEKLNSEMPLVFNAKIRTKINQEDGTIEGVEAFMKNLDNITSLKNFIVDSENRYKAKEGLKAVVEINEEETDKMEIIKKALERTSVDFEIPLVVKIYFKNKSYAVLEYKEAMMSESKIRKWKEIFGGDKFYLYKQ